MATCPFVPPCADFLMLGTPVSHISPARADQAWLRHRLTSGRRRPPVLVDGDFREPQDRTAYRDAAVLVPVVERESGLTILLTRRTAHLRDHAGQISFPGGRVESGDVSPAHTALREAAEEIGLAADRVELLGNLDDHTTATGFRITPVVGLVHQPFELVLDAFEVAEVFELPLEHLFEPANLQRNRIFHSGRMHDYYAFPWRDYYIWGATASMLKNLCGLLLDTVPFTSAIRPDGLPELQQTIET